MDSLYFTMLNGNKRSFTLNMKSDEGKEIFVKLLQGADIVVENFGPGVMDRLGFPWERIHEINPKVIYASLKGFGPGALQNAKAYENIAQATGGAMSTTGFEDGPPVATGAQIGDSGNAVHLFGAIVTALYQRTHTGRGQRVQISMRAGILNLCRVKLRDQQRLEHGPAEGVPEQGVPGVRAALGQRVGRRPAGLGGALQAHHQARDERVDLRRDPAPGVGAAGEEDRARGPARQPRLRHARGAARRGWTRSSTWSSSGR